MTPFPHPAGLLGAFADGELHGWRAWWVGEHVLRCPPPLSGPRAVTDQPACLPTQQLRGVVPLRVVSVVNPVDVENGLLDDVPEAEQRDEHITVPRAVGGERLPGLAASAQHQTV